MHPQVKRLLDLQKLDQQIARLRRDLDALPAETLKRQKALDAKRHDAAAKERAVQETELSIRNLELTTKQADDEVKKLDTRLNTVKNNAEYQATLLQIESVKRERDRVQEEALALLDKLAPLKATFAESRDIAQAEARVFETFQEEARKLVQAREVEVAAVAAGRASLLVGLPRELVERYDKLFKSRDGLSVCAVEGQVCQGCYNRITMNDIARLRGGASIVDCGSCNRILYLRDDSA